VSGAAGHVPLVCVANIIKFTWAINGDGVVRNLDVLEDWLSSVRWSRLTERAGESIGRAIPVQALADREGSSTLRLPDFKIIDT
jgi:hypothetical protein